MVKNWLITGGCGFIGRNLIKKLVEEGGHFIRVIDNLKVGTRDDLSMVCHWHEIPLNQIGQAGKTDKSVELVAGDILDPELALTACKGFDVIVHLAASTGVPQSVENPRMDCEINVTGTLNYLEAARQNDIKRFIFASSGAPAGEVEPPIHEELPPHPVSPYGASKLAGEGYCSAYYRTFGVEAVVLRFGNVYGPYSGKKDSVIAKFIKQAMAGHTVEIYGDGTQTRDFIYVDDLVSAVYKAATYTSPLTSNLSSPTSNIGGEIFQIATNREHTVNELADLLKEELKKQCNIEMAITYGSPRQGDVQRNFSDTSKAQRVLGWKSLVDLKTGIEKIVQWFADNTPPSLAE